MVAFLGTEDILEFDGGGAEPTVRPGWEKGSGEDSLPQRLPIFVGFGWRWRERAGLGWIGE